MQQLTVRERLILTYLAQGESLKEVAYRLGVSGVNAFRIYRKLGADNWRDAIRVATEKSLLNDSHLYCVRELRAEVERLRAQVLPPGAEKAPLLG